jgi:von Willebrand factor type A domain
MRARPTPAIPGLARTLIGLMLACLLAGTLTALPAVAQDGADEVNVELILDASGSMAARIGGESRMAIAKRVLRDVIAAIPEREGINVGLRLYGHRGDNSAAGRSVSCRSSELLVPVEGVEREALEDAVDGARATGWTPLARSLSAAADDFPPSDDDVVNAVVLLTDGLETCGGDPCAAAADVQASDVALISHVVSFAQSAEERAILRCIAEAGDGLLLSADDADELSAALFAILDELDVVDATGILEIEAFGDVWPAATAICAGRTSDSDPDGDVVTVRLIDTNRAEVPVGACDLSWRNPSGTTTRLHVAIEPGRVTWVRGSLLDLPQGAGESYAISDQAGLVLWEAPVEAFDRIWLLPGIYRIELAERVGDPVLIQAEISAIEGTVIRLSVGTEP